MRNGTLLQTVERPLQYTVARCLTLWHVECHVWRKPPWVFLWLNEKSHQRVPLCQTTIIYILPWKSYRSVATLSQGRAGKDKGLSGSLGVGCSLAHVWHRVISSPMCVESPARMSRIDLVSKNFLVNCFRNFSKKDLKKTAIKKIIEEIANVAKIAKVRRIFLAMWKDWVTNMAKIAGIPNF